MSTTARYGNIVLKNVTTRGWEQSNQFDASNTDVIYHQHVITLEGICHARPAGSPSDTHLYMSGPETQARDFSVIYDQVRRGLLAERQPFFLEMGGEPVFSCVPSAGNEASADRDVNNGPKPRSVDIVHVVSGGSPVLRVRWTIECSKVECPAGRVVDAPIGLALSPILSNRWRITESMDADMFTTRVISGKLRLSQAVGDMPIRDDFRGLVVPGLERGFRREAVEFTTTENGLECDYRVTDKQVHNAAPYPATTWSLEHSESASDHASAMISEIMLRLNAPPHADRELLIVRAFQAAQARLQFLDDSDNSAGVLVEDFRITELLGDQNTVSVYVRARRTQSAGDYFFNVRRDTLGRPLNVEMIEGEPAEYDPAVSSAPPTYGYTPEGERRPSVVLLLQCYLQTACYNKHGIPSAVEFIGGDSSSQNAPLVADVREYAVHGTLTPSTKNDLSEDALARVYTVGKLESSYRTKMMRLALPIADVPRSSHSEYQATSVMVDLAPPQCRRVLKFDCEAVGGWPSIPAPLDSYEDGTLTGHLISKELVPFAPPTSADRRRAIYRVLGKYIYAMNRAPNDTERLSVGRLPTVKYDKLENRFDPAVAFDETVGP